LSRRTWLFVAGADPQEHRRAAGSGAEVIILELEDFTPPELRPKARRLAASAFALWRKAGALAAVRVNPLESCGRVDLAEVLPAKPDIVLMSKVVSPKQVVALERATRGRLELVPNIETAAGLIQAFAIAKASRRVSAMLVASEDMVADLGTSRTRGAAELAYVREKFLVDCRAAGVEAIDCPYTFSDAKGAAAEARHARSLGYRMKSLVDPAHARGVNAALAPSAAELTKARRIVRAFESARAAGRDRASVDGALIEVPIYAAAKRLLSTG
jgi:citrate lyase subunit beta / citryl-CoA lyase